ncbi:putative COP9 signalosome complex subunit 1 [Paratrimastix pyriformis]|uniref:COP9 signalosome complex subunit 1 n=1 Tax=Paratrimastix pyriformis TaxID=342808 RepID=A0ABQ8UYC8_9EUKA|nr:putative COP9 signalosome complex subunit 1 [Paratrimastix pyriformis]
MDIYLHDHYFRSYVTVDLTRMAPAFNTTVGDLESELAALIMDGKIQARIDSHNKIMHSRTVNQRADTYETCLRTGDDFVEGSQAMLLRMNIQRQGLVVKAPRPTSTGATGA